MTKMEYTEMVYNLLLDHVIFDVFLEVTSDHTILKLALTFAFKSSPYVVLFNKFISYLFYLFQADVELRRPTLSLLDFYLYHKALDEKDLTSLMTDSKTECLFSHSIHNAHIATSSPDQIIIYSE